MRLVLLILVILFFNVQVFSQSNHETIRLDQLEWKIVDKNDSKVDTVKQQKCNVFFSEDGYFFETNLTIDDNFSFAAFYNLLTPFSFKMCIGSNVIENNLKSGLFYSNLCENLRPGNNKIVIKSNISLNDSDLINNLNGACISFFSEIGFTKVELKPDSFYGGKLIEVGLQNFTNNDIDGKIYAKIFDYNSNELITENNNCAFSMSNTEGFIEINFPNLEVDLKGKNVIVEFTMVDKEKDEEIIDQLTIPLVF